MARIAVVGAVGVGKTSLAKALAAHLNLLHTELDTLRYGPHWRPVDEKVFQARAAERIGEANWVIDGNHESVRDLLWVRADVLVWLDYPLPASLWRLSARTIRRLAGREAMSGQAREEWRRVLGSHSIISWAWRSHRKRRRYFEALLRTARYAHLRVVRLRRPAALPLLRERVLAELPAEHDFDPAPR